MSQESFKDYVEVAQKVIKNFPCSPLIIRTYHFSEKKAVWFIKTNKQTHALKRYKINDEQWDFMISAYDYLSKNNHTVPPLIPTINQKLWFTDDGYRYILTNWIKGYAPDYQSENDLIKLTKGLAELHLYSIDYPLNITYPTKHLGTKAEDLRLTQGLLLDYKHQASLDKSSNFSKTFLKEFKPTFELYEEVCSIFEKPFYSSWCEELKSTPCLCISSFAPHNFTLDEKGKLSLLHIDHICLDIPTHDLRKLLSKVMYLNNEWSSKKFQEIISTYLSINPLSNDQLEILLAELKTPYLVSNTLSRYYLHLAPTWSQDKFQTILNKVLRLEKEKLSIVKKFWSLLP